MWKKLFESKKPKQIAKPRNHVSPQSQNNSYITREGKQVRTDGVYEAWTSGDLDKMLNAVELETNPIDRHFLLMSIVDETYKHREELEMAEKCLEFGLIHINEFPSIAPALKKEMGGTLPRVTTFQKLATLLAERSKYDEAISVCERAVSLGLNDGTKSGYEGRIQRIKRSKQK